MKGLITHLTGENNFFTAILSECARIWNSNGSAAYPGKIKLKKKKFKSHANNFTGLCAYLCQGIGFIYRNSFQDESLTHRKNLSLEAVCIIPTDDVNPVLP